MAYPYVYNINYYTGDTYQFVLYPKNEDGTTLNLSGFTATFTIAPQRGAASSTIVLTPQINLNPTRIICTIDSNSGLSLINPVYVYDIEVSDNDETYTLLTGQINTQNHISISYQNIEIVESDVIIDGGIPTSIYYQVFDGGTP